MEKKFTPGEWSVIGNKVDGNGYHIASINSHATTEGAANARLIAAAPRLLDALLCALECLENNGFGKAYAEDICRAAIRKAKGE